MGCVRCGGGRVIALGGVGLVALDAVCRSSLLTWTCSNHCTFFACVLFLHIQPVCSGEVACYSRTFACTRGIAHSGLVVKIGAVCDCVVVAVDMCAGLVFV